MTPDDPERALALSYAPEGARAGLKALLALDDALGKVLRTTSEPALGRIRLAWWRERLEALDAGPPAAEPVLRGLFDHVLPAGVSGAALAGMVEGWELLFDAEGEDVLGDFGRWRGGRLFEAGAVVLGTRGDLVSEAGQGWALADLARNLSGGEDADAARAQAVPLLDAALATRWSREGRALGALAHLARLDLRGVSQPGSPRRVGRMLWHRLTGR
jgi:phytoene synthase